MDGRNMTPFSDQGKYTTFLRIDLNKIVVSVDYFTTLVFPTSNSESNNSSKNSKTVDEDLFGNQNKSKLIHENIYFYMHYTY